MSLWHLKTYSNIFHTLNLSYLPQNATFPLHYKLKIKNWFFHCTLMYRYSCPCSFNKVPQFIESSDWLVYDNELIAQQPLTRHFLLMRNLEIMPAKTAAEHFLYQGSLSNTNSMQSCIILLKFNILQAQIKDWVTDRNLMATVQSAINTNKRLLRHASNGIPYYHTRLCAFSAVLPNMDVTIKIRKHDIMLFLYPGLSLNIPLKVLLPVM